MPRSLTPLRLGLSTLALLVAARFAVAVEAPPAPAPKPPSAPGAVKATPEAYSSAKWEKEIAAYEKADRESPPRPGGIVFIGSSSIRLWKTLAEDFSGFNVLNRGFGGSRIADSVDFIPRIVVPYQPRQVFMYAGGNDLNAGYTSERVFKDFQAFATKVHIALPKTQICYIASSPNHKRWAQIDTVRALNTSIEAYCQAHPDYLKFINTFPLMLGEDGKPLPDIFVADGLHMNAKGYGIWTKHILPYLLPEPQP